MSADIHLETDGELPGKLPATYEIIPKALSEFAFPGKLCALCENLVLSVFR